VSGIRPRQFLDRSLLRSLRSSCAAGKEMLLRICDRLVPDVRRETHIYDLPYLWALLLDEDPERKR